jgi:hypothetical protein
MTQNSSSMPIDMEQDLLEREKRLLEREQLLLESEAELDRCQKILEEKEQGLIVWEKEFDRGDLDLEWEQIEKAQEEANQTEIGLRSLALDEKEKKIRLKKQQMKNLAASIQARRDDHNNDSHFGSCWKCGRG